MRKIFLLAFVLFIAAAAQSQPGNPTKPDQVPITGIEILIGIGSALGLTRFFKGRNKKHKEL